MSESVLLVLSTSKADVMRTWEKYGYRPTTDEDRIEMQKKHPHVEQCLCRFCQAEKA